MREPYTDHFRVLAILLAVACSSVPARAVAQVTPSPWCYSCEPVGDLAKCESTSKDGDYGRLKCKLAEGGKSCAMSSDPSGSGGDDCVVEATLGGRVSLDVVSEPWPQGVGGAAVPRRLTSVHLVDSPVVLVRHECSGAIIRRRYSSARIAELRSGLRRVTI